MERNEFQKRIGVGEPQYRYGRHVGSSKVTPVWHEDNGKLSGFQTEHWSGRVDARVTAPRITLRAKASEE